MLLEKCFNSNDWGNHRVKELNPVSPVKKEVDLFGNRKKAVGRAPANYLWPLKFQFQTVYIDLSEECVEEITERLAYFEDHK
jgi:hypothetical protein